jgi:RNA polymerase-binding transcription factor
MSFYFWTASINVLQFNNLFRELGMVAKTKTTKAKTAAKKATSTKRKPAAKKTATTKKSAAAKKPVAKKTTAKKAPAKKTAVKKPAAKKAAPKKAATKKTAAKKPVAKKAPAKKTTAKKPAAKKTTVKKPAAKKPAAKKATVKKPAAKKTTTKKKSAVKTTTKTSTAKKPVKKAAAPKATPKAPAPKTVKVKAAVAKATTQQGVGNKKARPATKQKFVAPIRSAQLTMLGIEPYIPSENEDYMGEKQREHFIHILNKWRQILMEEVDRTVTHMKDEAANFPDPNDRASQEEEFSLELRTRDRERKLIRKIEKTVELIKRDEYGFCDICGVDIGIRRLEARPTATLCIDCKTLDEIKEKQLIG